MSPPDERLSETSPLLGHQSNGDASSKSLTGGTANGVIGDDGADVGPDLERHESIDESRAAQFQGRPEVMKQLKYIVPAFSVGVWLIISQMTTGGLR
jgi:hypothetical protein